MSRLSARRSSYSWKSVLFLTLSIDLVAVTAAALLAKGQFEEGGAITFLSLLQLVFMSVVAWSIFKTRKGASEPIDWKTPYVLWLIISAGFLYLAMDEMCGIHEMVDILIHKVLGIQETDLSDRIDDAIVAICALIGLASLFVYRAELKNDRAAFPLLVVGCCLLLLRIALDAFTNRQDYTTRLWRSIPKEFYSSYPREMPLVIRPWLMFFEDALKVIGEGVLIGFFHDCLVIAGRYGTRTNPGAQKQTGWQPSA